MKVTLKDNWFAPSDPTEIGKRVMSGRLYKRGEHVLDDSLLKFLPKTAKVLDEVAPMAPAPKKRLGETLRDYDELRSAADAEEKVVDAVNKAVNKGK